MTRIGNTPESGNVPPSTPSRDLIAGSGSASSAAKGVPCTIKGVEKSLKDDHKVSTRVPQEGTVRKVLSTFKNRVLKK